MNSCISVVLLNFNNSLVTLNCIHSLLYTIKPFLKEILVVENSSTESEIQILETGVINLELVKIIYSNENLGFSKGCNLGASKVVGGHGYLWFLNNDSWLESSFGLDKIINLLNIKNTGLIGNSILLENGLPTPNVGVTPTFLYLLLANIGLGKKLRKFGLYNFGLKLAKFNTNLNALTKAQEMNSPGLVSKVFSVSGCSMFCSVSTFKKIGGFDGNFFIYDEDTDISIRSNQLGFNNYHVSDFKIYTKPHTTTGKYPELMRKHRLNSRKYFIKKHFKGIPCQILLASLYFFPNSW